MVQHGGRGGNVLIHEFDSGGLCMRLSFSVLLIGWAFLGSTTLSAEDFFLTIGGGSSPPANQASLEKNVLFFQRVLDHQKLTHCTHDIFFSDGNEAGRDLQVINRNSVPEANRLMAEFFGSRQDLGLHYRNHTVADVRDGTRPENIRTWFEEVGANMESGDRLIVYVTAHGSRSKDRENPHDTTIATWNNTSIKMTEFVSLLDGLPEDVGVVAIMVQCHSGGFARFIFDGGNSDRGLAAQNRVGFFATVHDRPASGCTAEVDDEENYVEYSTFFWAALSGRDRNGNTIAAPDYNGDDVVSFDEAHAYTILTADTIDLPLQTSDEFLSVYSRLKKDEDADLLGKSESYELILDLATESQRAVLEGLSEQLELAGDDRIVDARKAIQSRRGSSRRGRPPESPSSQLRRRIAGDIERRWPELANVLNPVAIELVTTRSEELVDAIKGHRDYDRYRELVDQQKSSIDGLKKKVKYERFLQAADRIALEENLRRLNDAETIAQYEAIIRAEAGTLLP